eukprot:gnl/TRDRNA2_/TRDRNA2_68188_c0_seq1.p1 gnl/TRDRNA2_/TRDRNA2_68188_c0~~gnl/TRDRNA2_/TRDRNA2_68188_c0_seq1.p1  ORF type:complete len:333 (-),score=45.98 gnl/TRDRNA2_/TRDRNA2_68188_c0_seq1:145-1053(-)
MMEQTETDEGGCGICGKMRMKTGVRKAGAGVLPGGYTLGIQLASPVLLGDIDSTTSGTPSTASGTSPALTAQPTSGTSTTSTATSVSSVGLELVSEFKSWDAANQHCKSLGSSLVKISSQDIHDQVLAAASRFEFPSGMEHLFWLGGSDLDQEGRWTWASDGTTFPPTSKADERFSSWKGDEPNGGSGESCLALSGSAWIDKYCRDVFPFFCLGTRSATTRPTTTTTATMATTATAEVEATVEPTAEPEDTGKKKDDDLTKNELIPTLRNMENRSDVDHTVHSRISWIVAATSALHAGVFID